MEGKKETGRWSLPTGGVSSKSVCASPGVRNALVPAPEGGPRGGGAARGVVVGLVY